MRTLAAGRRVLNLFAYTGGFSIYAAAGGARATVTVDVAAPAIAAARRNFERNGLATGDDRFVAGDAFAFLERAAKFAVGGVTAAMLLDSLTPRFAEAQQVAKDDKRLHAQWIDYESPQGTGKVKAYLVRPEAVTTKPKDA